MRKNIFKQEKLNLLCHWEFCGIIASQLYINLVFIGLKSTFSSDLISVQNEAVLWGFLFCSTVTKFSCTLFSLFTCLPQYFIKLLGLSRGSRLFFLEVRANRLIALEFDQNSCACIPEPALKSKKILQISSRISLDHLKREIRSPKCYTLI